jgi:hypothetical protein
MSGPRGITLFLLFLAVGGLPSAGAEQTGEYIALNPWNSWAPDCHAAAGGISLGLGGACFTVPADAATFRVTLVDDVLGPGYGGLNLCDDNGCLVYPICEGVAEGTVPAGTDRASVATWDATMALRFCGPNALTWAPTHGTISLAFDE